MIRLCIIYFLIRAHNLHLSQYAAEVIYVATISQQRP